MDQNLGNSGGNAANQGSEDNREATQHVQNAAENRDALAAQNRRTEATTSAETRDHPVEGMNATGGTLGGNSGSSAAPGRMGSEDNSQAAANVRNVQENRDALEDQNRRTEASAPPSTDQPIR